MKKRETSKPLRTCGECIHEYACAMWNVGSLHNTNAMGCANYETVKMSAAYFIGRMDGKQEALAEWRAYERKAD